jgi:hypothetical protein
MTIQAQNLSAEQKQLLEDLLGHPLTETETIHLRSVSPEPGPAWLHDFWPTSTPTLALAKVEPFTYSPAKIG